MDKETMKLFTLIAEGTDKEKLDSAMKIVNGAEDQTLKSELDNFGVAMMQAKNSTEMDKVKDSLKLYFKKQMSLVFCQAFVYGQKYQHAIDLVVITEAVNKANDEVSGTEKNQATEEKGEECSISE